MKMVCFCEKVHFRFIYPHPFNLISRFTPRKGAEAPSFYIT